MTRAVEMAQSADKIFFSKRNRKAATEWLGSEADIEVPELTGRSLHKEIPR